MNSFNLRLLQNWAESRASSRKVPYTAARGSDVVRPKRPDDEQGCQTLQKPSLNALILYVNQRFLMNLNWKTNELVINQMNSINTKHLD